ncbi:MAG: 23S rRNA (adenine(2503)-C(2))-methyltransferase RlmN [Deltaproteobacteria bacterium]|nr:23S rRNA (adenine(2503)-C(2))-methyltransferase RlmN [Deltaproteobacteria bacterium]MCX7953384.1 23S rRNA (adenine(2503)-C(2))-methyltransferase RlmN [Deltaproteobacteria bacterium]
MLNPDPETIEIFDLSREELRRILLDFDANKYYLADQIFDWVYKKLLFDFSKMTNIPEKLRAVLSAKFTFSQPEIVFKKFSADGSCKFVMKFGAQKVESVLMRHNYGLSLCVSSQAGCGMGCKFCKTATLGFGRNLTTSEILQQIIFGLISAKKSNLKLRNVVFMGMGEPFHNYENVKKTILILTDPKGLGFSWRNVTVSTVGLINRIKQFFEEKIPSQLAISLNAPTQEKRKQIMPISARFPLEELVETIGIVNLRPRQKIFLEYVLLGGFNTSNEDLSLLIKLLKPIRDRIKVNLIPFNSFEGAIFQRPPTQIIEKWRNELVKNGFTATVRWSKAVDILGGCGQLAGVD